MIRFSTFLGFAAFGVFAAPAAHAQPISPDQLMQHIRVLASDEYEGRAPGTAGGERTEAYLIEAFARAGLKPGATGGTWRQPVRMIERSLQDSSTSFVARGQPLALPADAVALVGRERQTLLEDAPVLFIGYGTDRDTKGLDVKGAVLLMLRGEPARYTGPDWRERRAALAAAGAGATLVIVPDEVLPRVAVQGRRTVLPAHRPFAAAEGYISRGAATILTAAGGDANPIIASAEALNFTALRLPVAATIRARSSIRTFETANIVGKVEGQSRPGEAVVVMAHWDHLGLCRPDGAPDRICNGAVDNASGTAILIETARAIAAGTPLVRSIYFLATTLEEAGGLEGATIFAEQPPEPISRIVAVLNVDTTALAPRGLPVAIIGRGRFPSVDGVVDDTSRSLRRKVDTDTEANVMIERQDGWAFTRRGIPSIMATGSVSNMALLGAYLQGPYHGPNDDLQQRIELGGAAEDTDLHIALARALADPSRYKLP